MNQLSEEQLQQIVETPAGERIRMKCGAADLRSVITDALSLLDSDSQVAEISTSAHELAVEWSQSTSEEGISVDDINRLAQLIDQRVTLMRDKCVETLKAVKSKWAHKPVLTHSALDEAISALESLILDQVKPGEM